MKKLRENLRKRYEFYKSNTFNDRILFLVGYDELPEILQITEDAEALFEAAENYELAPLNIKHYYLELYKSLLKQYDAELEAEACELRFTPEYSELSV